MGMPFRLFPTFPLIFSDSVRVESVIHLEPWVVSIPNLFPAYIYAMPVGQKFDRKRPNGEFNYHFRPW